MGCVREYGVYGVEKSGVSDGGPAQCRFLSPFSTKPDGRTMPV